MLEVTDLTLSIRGRVLVSQLCCRVDSGAIVVVLGPNGSGKTSMLRTLAGELRPDAGRILLEGDSIEHLDGRALARRRAVLSQHLELDFPFSVSEIVGMGCVSHPSAEAAAVLQGALIRHTLDTQAERLYPSLSGGERQRVHLARVEAQASPSLDAGRPFLLLLDEPATHLDPAHQRELANWMRGMAQRGAAILTILHDFQLAASVADRVILLDGRGGAQEGAAAELLQPEPLSQIFGLPVGVASGQHGEPVLYPGFGSQFG